VTMRSSHSKTVQKRFDWCNGRVY